MLFVLDYGFGLRLIVEFYHPEIHYKKEDLSVLELL